MPKRDPFLQEELQVANQKEAQRTSDLLNIFYMFVLAVTIIGSIEAQLVSVHFAIKAAPDSTTLFTVSPLAIDAVASVLMIAGFGLSYIFFQAYFLVAQEIWSWRERREVVQDLYLSTEAETLKTELAEGLQKQTLGVLQGT